MHEPEEKFNMDKYTDLVTVSKPVIYISIEEIINTHLVSGVKGGLGPNRGSDIHSPESACALVSVFKPCKLLP